ncbi:MAG: PadR family transcriptional regulator [Candidatus Bathyarchaeota archaeon]|nr:PadR family transcriptional regulator [Candidatus Bathyarchaeota archaeon]
MCSGESQEEEELVELLSAEAGKCQLKLRRRLVKNFLDVLVLIELQNTHLSGYDVMTLVYRRFRILLGSGSVYSLLYRMEREGLIAGTWIERRRIYGLTDKGKAVAEATDDFFEDFMDLSVLTVSGTH